MDADNFLKHFVRDGETGIDPSLVAQLIEKVTEANTRLAREGGREQEREELICRLLASGMPAEEISLILKIRVEVIRDIDEYNRSKIADYAKKLKTRRKSRERAAKHNQEMQ